MSDVEHADRRLRRRYATERAFRAAGLLAIVFALSSLFALVGSIAVDSLGALSVYSVRLELELDPADLDPLGDRSAESLASGNAASVLREGLLAEFPDVTGRSEKRALSELLSVGAQYDLLDFVEADPDVLGTRHALRAVLSDDVDLVLRGELGSDVAEADRKLSDAQLAWLAALEDRGRIEKHWNFRFLQTGDSRDPELAGVQGAIRGSFLTLLVTLLVSFPIGVAAAIYLEEFAPRNRLTDLIEVNINNLAAVPSIVFGLLGLAVFLNVFGLPRSAPLVGGLVLGLMTLPTVIIAARAALSAVPPSIREAALGIGASPTQAVHASRRAPGIARNPHGHDHRHGAGAGRDGTPLDDRDGGFHRRPADGADGSIDGATGPDLPLGGGARACLRGEDGGSDPRAARIPGDDELGRGLCSPPIRVEGLSANGNESAAAREGQVVCRRLT